MPIAKHKPDAESPIKTNLPKVQPDGYKGVVNDADYVPLNSLISYIDGSPWNSNYYGQILSEHNNAREFDIGQSGAYQQYSKTNGLELRVTTPLTSSYDETKATILVTGSAFVYPFFVPNRHDVFVAAIPGGSDGMFSITNVERKVFNRDSVYQIDYVLIGDIAINQEKYALLEDRVNATYYFHKERMSDGLNPAVTTSEHHDILDLSELQVTLCQYYFKTFFSREYSTLIVPGQETTIYDSFVVKYLLRLLDTFAAYELRFVKDLNTEFNTALRQEQFWDALFQRNADMLLSCNTRMGVVNRRNFSFDPGLEGFRYTSIQYIVYPVAPDKTLLNGEDPVMRDAELDKILPVASKAGKLSSLVTDVYIDQNRSVPFIKPVLGDPYYVLTKAFYENSNGQSILESLTSDYIRRKEVDTKKLAELTKSYRNWGRLEQYYYIPIILTLIQSILRGR